jgi:nicotinamidase-related amidase
VSPRTSGQDSIRRLIFTPARRPDLLTEADGKTTTGLAAYLKARKLQRLFVAGLATDF